MLTAQQAIERLKQGNQRFADEQMAAHRLSGADRRAELVEGQTPFAILLGCSDSRVPAEFVFDQGVGDLFVIRVAGNIVAPSQIGSVEFAASSFGTRLVVVLGHSGCGAVSATLGAMRGEQSAQTPGLRAIVDRVRPSLEPLIAGHADNAAEPLMQQAVRANIVASANHLRHGSALLEKLIAEEGLMIVGAEYCLETGLVDFFDNA